MYEMFRDATKFNQCLSSWADKSQNYNYLNVNNMFYNSGCNGPNTPAVTVSPWCQGAADGCFAYSNAPSGAITSSPSEKPSEGPSFSPSEEPVESPSDVPSVAPSNVPSSSTSEKPSFYPSEEPVESPSNIPSIAPSDTPSDVPSSVPSNISSSSPSEPSEKPSSQPSLVTSSSPSAKQKCSDLDGGRYAKISCKCENLHGRKWACKNKKFGEKQKKFCKWNDADATCGIRDNRSCDEYKWRKPCTLTNEKAHTMIFHPGNCKWDSSTGKCVTVG